MISAGQTLILKASRRTMRYQDIRQHVQDHYRSLLRGFKEDVSAHGPIEGQRLDSLRASKGWAEADPEEFLGIGYPDGLDGLLRKFCELAGIREELTPPDRKLFVQEIAKAFQTFAAAALDHNASFDEIELEDHVTVGAFTPATLQDVHETYEEVVRQYLVEGARADAWAAKTLGEKEDALSLLGEVTGGKPLCQMTKADAREVKDVLLRLPRNRRKNPATRDLVLRDMLAVKGAQVIAARTLNAYISNMQSFFKWAVNNGHAEVNVFDNTRIRIANKTTDDDRKAFTDEQLRLIFRHLTENPDGLVKKDDHKWPSLIAMFSGMRLNEVAQLQPDDVRQVDEVWCFDVNTKGDTNKSLKNQSSHRLVPVHQRLLDAGILTFLAAQKTAGVARLFPSLTYSKQNGYGRNTGRWFNDRLLPALGMPKRSGLMFHCMRHTMITQLGQKDIPDTHLRAIVGHRQTGVTYNSYFKAGFLPSQLQRAVNQFFVLDKD
jgi:integrase